MSYNLYCCADINGKKVNLELAFESKPDDLAYMAEQIEFVFRKNCFDKNQNSLSFTIDIIIFYEESSKKWKPLENCHQLHEQSQLYIFQTNVAKENLLEIPAASAQIFVPHLPDPKSRNVHNPGYSVVDPDKIEAVFNEIDINDNQYITIDELQHAFVIAGIDFKEEAIEKLFDKSDANGDGRVSFDEFRIFADLFPNTTEVLYWRLCHGLDSQNPRCVETARSLKTLRQQEHDFRKELARIAEATKVLESRLRQERNIARETDPRRRFLEAEEQDLMNKEFALQFHRDMVIQAENLFSETAVRFDHTAMNHGSPRRARMLPQ